MINTVLRTTCISGGERGGVCKEEKEGSWNLESTWD